MKSDKLKEEAPANSAGGGNIAAIGVGPNGEPPKATKKKLVKRSFKEFMKNV